MCTFLNVPLFGFKRTYQIYAQHSLMLPYPLMTICPYSEQVEDIEHLTQIVGDHLNAKMN